MAETILKSILQELTENEKRVSQDEMEKFADAILKADRIFVAGAGRTGFVARAFANRLMHMGMTVFFVGEPTTPAIKAGDLLVIGSGSGETGSLVVMAQKAMFLIILCVFMYLFRKCLFLFILFLSRCQKVTVTEPMKLRGVE